MSPEILHLRELLAGYALGMTQLAKVRSHCQGASCVEHTCAHFSGVPGGVLTPTSVLGREEQDHAQPLSPPAKVCSPGTRLCAQP